MKRDPGKASTLSRESPPLFTINHFQAPANKPSGNSTALTEINKKPAETLAQKWDNLGEGAHVGVYVGAGVAGAAMVGAFAFWCLRQRRKGRLEHALDDTRYNDQRSEAANYQNDWKQTEWRNSGYRQVS